MDSRSRIPETKSDNHRERDGFRLFVCFVPFFARLQLQGVNVAPAFIFEGVTFKRAAGQILRDMLALASQNHSQRRRRQPAMVTS